MSSTLGQPGFVPSNRTGQSGVGPASIGALGSGVLQTIEEGAGAQIVDPFYYDKSVGYYQLPSVQRARGDDIKTINITHFGARGTVTLPRRYFNFGPAALRFRLPIQYAWSGCEYLLNSYDTNTIQEAIQVPKLGDFSGTGNPYPARTDKCPALPINGGRLIFESPGCDTMLPTSFMSGGAAFAFPSQIELNMGGGGNLTFDRYANWVAIMASAPYVNIRKDLMRMAGGGLCLSDPYESKQAPVRWAKIPWCGPTGYTEGQLPMLITNAVGSAFGLKSMNSYPFSNTKFVPIEWDVLLPIKTPDTNFMYALERRKPLDTSCFSGDFQMTFTWSNFNEWTDTGKGYPNAPVYYTQRTTTKLFALANGKVDEGGGASGHRGPFTITAPLGYQGEANANGTIAPFAGEIGSPIFVNTVRAFTPVFSANYAAENTITCQIGSVIGVNPSVWCNHYRVASGAPLKEGFHYKAAQKSHVSFNDAAGANIASENVGRVRFPQGFNGIANQGVYLKSQQMSADSINSTVTYPVKFSSIEYINSNLKLTNQALGAYNELRVSKEAVLYYPFQYFFSQIYRVTTSKFKEFKNCGTQILKNFETYLSDIYSEANKMTQMIQMPANPCTAMMVCIFREKDRQTLVQGKMNSYSPVLFWNALNPERIDLKDGGNTLFSYRNSVDFEYYSLMDRPDALKIPFRGGHVKVQPNHLYGNRHITFGGALNTGMLTSPLITTSGKNAVDNDPFIKATVVDTSFMKPFWYIGTDENIKPNVGIGYQGVNKPDGIYNVTNPSASHPSGTVNGFPADFLCDTVALDGLGSGKRFPCHTTEWFEASIIEFPFVMNEPITNEKIVQQTPSFAKTQLQLDFWINPFLKPDNGMDDMYDTTYGITRAVPDGVGAVAEDQADATFKQARVFGYPGPVSHPVPDCLRGCGSSNPLSIEMQIRDRIGVAHGAAPTSDPVRSAPGTGLTTFLETTAKYADGYLFSDSTSWNNNSGDLMLHITFCQNQIWTLSPLRTALLQARG